MIKKKKDGPCKVHCPLPSEQGSNKENVKLNFTYMLIKYLKWLFTPSKKIAISNTLRVKADIFPDAEWLAYVQRRVKKFGINVWVFEKGDDYWFHWFQEGVTVEEIKQKLPIKFTKHDTSK